MLTKASTSANLQPISFDSARSGLISPNPSPRQPGYAISLEEGELKLSMVKEVECVDSYDIDIEVHLIDYSNDGMRTFRQYIANTPQRKCPCLYIAGKCHMGCCCRTTNLCISLLRNKLLNIG